MKTSGHVFYLTLIALLAGGLIFTYHEMDRRSQISTRNEMVLHLLACKAYSKPSNMPGIPVVVKFSDGPDGYAEAYHIFKSAELAYWGLSFPTKPPYRSVKQKQLEEMREEFGAMMAQ